MKQYLLVILLLSALAVSSQNNLKLSEKGYFTMHGLDVTVFADIYPEGHQTGVTIIQHGERVAANGDIRLETSPGQWSPVPKAYDFTIDSSNNVITQRLCYPDSSRDRKGFNPIVYPDLQLCYSISVTPVKRNSFKISVNLDKPLPKEWVGKIGFNLEFFPGHLFGKTYQLDKHIGIFPLQPSGPMISKAEGSMTISMGKGKKLIVAPEDDLQRVKIESKGIIELWDGRSNHNNGWFIVRETIDSDKTENVIEWTVTPNVVSTWEYEPVIHVSQVGYHPEQEKTIIIEKDYRDETPEDVSVFRITEEGNKEVKKAKANFWGKFLRYNYFKADISDLEEPGMYIVSCKGHMSNPFKIDVEVFGNNIWQPVIDYFLPAQMCHMRVEENYRVWHDVCHLDDALMAPAGLNHFDGYRQGSSSLCKYQSSEHVPGLNRGGWHDAGDDDLRIESQIGEIILLSMMLEEFNLNYDVTTVDDKNLVTKIHVPDGKNDLIQQIEHGLNSILGGYRSMNRLYRGIITPTIEQYVILGDPSSVTDNSIGTNAMGRNIPDDRWVFTEENARHECMSGSGLAIASRVLNISNPTLSDECLKTSIDIWERWGNKAPESDYKLQLLTELFLSTKSSDYEKEIIRMGKFIVENISRTGVSASRLKVHLSDKKLISEITSSIKKDSARISNLIFETPFGVPYKPVIWGAGWSIQHFGVEQYFLNKAWPEIISANNFMNALNFVLGVHPGKNTVSFASGIGSKSATTAYGFNRADWSHIPGGVISGTALIRPDLPELKEWPYFWQQTEYVMGGGSTNFMFLVLAVDNYLKKH